MSGIAALPRFKMAAPEMKIVMLTINDDDASITTAFERGADGYVAKTAGLDEVAKAIHEAVAGQKQVDPATMTTLLKSLEQDRGTLFDSLLSARELDVLRLVAQGLSRGGIARSLGLSVGTVISHQRSIHQKLHVKKATEAVAKAIRLRLV
jgi:DNA-binding NarL/FixJ family response regulator